jgi:hypothetical protein
MGGVEGIFLTCSFLGELTALCFTSALQKSKMGRSRMNTISLSSAVMGQNKNGLFNYANGTGDEDKQHVC